MFDPSGNLVQQFFDFGTSAGEPAPDGNVYDTNIFFGQTYLFNPFGGFIHGTSMPLFQPGLAVLGDQPNAQPLPAPQFTNAYSVTLSAGESASFVISDLHGSDISFQLEDSSGNLIALSSPGGKSFAQGITDFVSASGGTYVVLVTGGTSGDKYNLVVTENAGFDAGNSTQLNPPAAASQRHRPGCHRSGLWALTRWMIRLLQPAVPDLPDGRQHRCLRHAVRDPPLDPAEQPLRP